MKEYTLYDGANQQHWLTVLVLLMCAVWVLVSSPFWLTYVLLTGRWGEFCTRLREGKFQP